MRFATEIIFWKQKSYVFTYAFVILKSFIFVNLVNLRIILFALQYGQQALVYADVLLFGLYHPNSLFPHFEYDAKNIHNVIFANGL